MEQLNYPSQLKLLQIFAASLALHGMCLLGLGQLSSPAFTPKKVRVPVQIVEKPKAPETKPAAGVSPQEAPAPRKINEPKVPPKAATPPPVVQGLSAESFSDKGTTTMAAPAGNTTMAPDEGKRLSPEEIRSLDKNLSQDAVLIAGSFLRPAYTPEAEDAGLEGRFIVEVFVNEQGQVTAAELRKSIGYGMDERVLASAKQSRFQPRRDAKGQAMSGWTEIKVRLTID